MQSRKSWRLVACIAPPLAAISVFAMVSCRDATRPLDSNDWAERTLVSVQVTSQLNMVSGGTIVHTEPRAARIYETLARGDDRFQSSVRAAGPPREVLHVRAKNGHVFSFAKVSSGDGSPPSRMYFFENGRIRGVASSKYKRHDAGWLRTSSRLSLFDSLGRPLAQVETHTDSVLTIGSTEPSSNSSGLHIDQLSRAVADVLLPAQLHAEEGPCTTEWLAVASASLIVADYLAILSTESAACADGILPSCALISPTAAKLLAAMAALNLAWDKLKDCREKKTIADGTGGGSGGGGGGGGSGSDDNYDPWPNGDDSEIDGVKKTVEEFIAEAEAAGRFTCSSDGNHCIYYAE